MTQEPLLVGNGAGFSVQQVIAMAGQVTGRLPSVVEAARRAGEPAILVADAKLARTELGWQPRYDDLATIVGHALAWERKLSAKPSAAA